MKRILHALLATLLLAALVPFVPVPAQQAYTGQAWPSGAWNTRPQVSLRPAPDNTRCCAARVCGGTEIPPGEKNARMCVNNRCQREKK